LSRQESLIPLERPVVKHTPAEFLVRESPFVSLPGLETKAEARFTYLELTKSGLTTFEAVAVVAHHFDLPRERILFAGLKDEDGITEQLIALECHVTSAAVAEFNATHEPSRQASISLRRYGAGDEPLRTGGLTGNSFRIRIRNLSHEAVARLTAVRRYDFHFLNYYDRQRFGLPNAPKTTHLIGKALLDCDYSAALSVLQAACTPESASALRHTGPPEEFFASMDTRVTSFYKSSYSSFVWNGRLRDLIADLCLSETYEDSQDGIDFLFSRRHAEVLAVLARQPAIEYTKHYGDGVARVDDGLRSTVVQVQVHCHGAGSDEAHTARYRCDLSFFLPSGAYATMCVQQLVNALDLAAPMPRSMSSGSAVTSQ
jgi:tRNA pseudouridine13 synthase